MYHITVIYYRRIYVYKYDVNQHAKKYSNHGYIFTNIYCNTENGYDKLYRKI